MLTQLDDKNLPLVTVALPVCNGGSLLRLSIESILRQSWPHWELIILDDGSTDGSIDELYKLSDSRMSIIRDTCNRGIAMRLNQAISLANGKYFARIDHDDICHPERFFKQIQFLENHPEVDLLATSCVTISENGQLTGVLPFAINHKDICRTPWSGFYMAHPTWMGRLQWFQNNRYTNPAPYRCEDQELLLRAHRTSCYHTFPEKLLAYRIQAHIPWSKLCRTHLSMLKMQSRYFLKQNELVAALLSGVAALARIGRDSWKELRYKLKFPRKVLAVTSLSPAELSEWKTLIDEIIESARKLDC
jgi:glycosyltransferase involved in cell wall biosynthesis